MAGHNSNSGLVNVIFRDVLSTGMLLFVALFSYAVVLIAKQQVASAREAAIEMPGSLAATITWPEGNIDVDLWVTGPGEPVPVGYSNKGGLLWNLLRDDLGTVPDFLGLNYENAYTRGLPPGDYRINVHCYRCPILPVEVLLEVASINAAGKKVVIGNSTITLRSDHQEKTGLAFHVDPDGTVPADSMNTIFEPLRTGTKQ